MNVHENSDIIDGFNSCVFEKELRHLQSYSFIPDAIYKLEKSGLSVESQIKIFKNVEERVFNLNIYKARFLEIQTKNPDLQFFKDFNYMRCSEEDKMFSHVPLTTTDVERSFSK
jgi:hypothetical protein